MAINSNSAVGENIELEALNKPIPGGLTPTTPILKRKAGDGSKKLQFSTPECSVTPIATIPGINSTKLYPSRRRYEHKSTINFIYYIII